MLLFHRQCFNLPHPIKQKLFYSKLSSLSLTQKRGGGGGSKQLKTLLPPQQFLKPYKLWNLSNWGICSPIVNRKLSIKPLLHPASKNFWQTKNITFKKHAKYFKNLKILEKPHHVMKFAINKLSKTWANSTYLIKDEKN